MIKEKISLFFVFIETALVPNKSLPPILPTLPSPTFIFSSSTPTITKSSQPTSTLTPIGSNTPTTTATSSSTETLTSTQTTTSTSSPTSTLTNTQTATPTSSLTATTMSTETATAINSPIVTSTIFPLTNTPINLEPAITPKGKIFKPPDTTENIHVAQIFNDWVTNPDEEIGKVDLVWGSSYAAKPKGVYNLFYYPFDRDLDRDIGGTNHDINWYLTNHPDWIEYTCDKTTPAYEYGGRQVPIDITNPAVLDYIMQTYIIPAIQKGYQGIAFDNVDFNNNGGRCGVWRDGQWVGQPNYIENLLVWAEWMYTHLHAKNVLVAMNFPFDINQPRESYQLYQFIDIVVDERGFTNWGGGQGNYLSNNTWLTNMLALESLDANEKGFVTINEMPEPFTQVSQKEKQWALANYLLAKGKYSYIAITGIQEYGYLFNTPEYFAAIGYALNFMYKEQGVYMRDFSTGKAIVNPSASQSFTISLIANKYQDLYGNKLNTITLEPRGGIVLIARPQPPSP